MGRSESYIGLNAWAREFVEGEQVHAYSETITREMPDGTKTTVGPKDVYVSNVCVTSHDTIEGAYGGEYPLFQYTFDDGSEYFEHLQAEPWSSGPCYYLALRDSKGDPLPKTLWTDEELDDA
jgi:hypothetical protein